MYIEKFTYKIVFIIFLIVLLQFKQLELVLATSCICIGLLFIGDKNFISKNTFNVLVLLGMIGILGFIISLFNKTIFYDKIRDILHFTKPILLILLGYLFTQKIRDYKFIIKTIIIIAVVFSIKHLIVLATLSLDVIDVGQIRQKGGDFSFIELLALILMLFRKQYIVLDVIRSKAVSKLIFIVLLVSSGLYLSRTMILGFLIFYLSIKGYTKLSKKAIKYGSLFLVLIGLFYTYLLSMNLKPQESETDKFLLKIRNAPVEVFVSPNKYHPDNLREIYHHWRAYEASNAIEQMKGNVFNYIWGKGFGSLVDLKFKAPIGGVDGLRYIPHLHNGYVYIFYKTGAIGLLLYVFVLFVLYRQVYKNTDDINEVVFLRIVSGFSLYFFFTTLVITGLYNLKETAIFFLGIFLYLAHKKS